MINAIAELGKYEKVNNPNIKTNFDIWLEDSYDERNYPHLLLIEFTKEKNEDKEGLFGEDWKWVFNKIDYREHSTNLKSKLLYKRGKGSNGPDLTPTSKVTELEKTFEKKIVKWFESNKNYDSLDGTEKYFLTSIETEFKEKSDEILLQLKEKSGLIDTKGFVLSISFLESGKQKFIGDFDFFSKFYSLFFC